MKETVKLGLTLFVITAISALILSLSNGVTAPIIEEAAKNKEALAKAEILDGADEFEELDQAKFEELKKALPELEEVNLGKANGQEVGYTFKAKTIGYKGDIEFLLGISNEGEIKGLKFLSHGETPGLGANIEKPFFYESFKDKSVAEDLMASKTPKGESEVQALTSATITTDAVVGKINSILSVYNEFLAE